MEHEPRTTAPAHATGAVAFVPLAAVDDDATYRVRPEGDVSHLAASIGRLGQLSPVELRPHPTAPGRYQVIAGFRRLAALRMLMRERVLARIHERLEDDDAWGIALAQALLTEPLDGEALLALRTRLAESGVAPWADELVDEARVRAPVEPELRERFFAFLEAGAPASAPASAPGEPPSAEPEGGTPPVDEDAAFERELEADEAEREPPGEVEVEVTPDELAEDVARRLWELNQDLALAAGAWAELPPEGRHQILAQARWLAALLPHLEGDDE
ncbi:ParB N-terminal domain-containing protein [Anaeromyxobacter sp. Fw109-5]|uniref:ParB N-terminal domain-containing protein n=1 Tax=Anaeromyxobacter sp. (strain Fw109-5) TaxID=404589 RepID=UPI0000ED718C|nr:ParB N-terminal domain-containing protein [Anaeromyxobacter sp. Fw109-5]ABS27869.1 ParB domain protein nuclease [Anaeromyxobacter sp. Fw109-5]